MEYVYKLLARLTILICGLWTGFLPMSIGFAKYGFTREGTQLAGRLANQIMILSFLLGILFYVLCRLAGRANKPRYDFLRYGVNFTFFPLVVNLAIPLFLTGTIMPLGICGLWTVMVGIHFWCMYRVDPTTPE